MPSDHIHRRPPPDSLTDAERRRHEIRQDVAIRHLQSLTGDLAGAVTELELHREITFGSGGSGSGEEALPAPIRVVLYDLAERLRVMAAPAGCGMEKAKEAQSR